MIILDHCQHLPVTFEILLDGWLLVARRLGTSLPVIPDISL